MKSVLVVSALLLTVPTFAAPSDPLHPWINGPEAIFAIQSERAEWFMLRTDQERERFKERYWSRRDPTPGTPRNEFRDVVEQRIRVADQRFSIDNLPGSQTARGFAFILLGTPARVQETHLRPPAAGQPNIQGIEGNEVISTWRYDRLRTPKILEVLDRPELELTFRLEPSRRRDTFEPPGAIDEIRGTVARRSIVAQGGAANFDPLSAGDLSAAARRDLDAAARDAAPLKYAALWDQSGETGTLLWLHLPDPSVTGHVRIEGRVVDADDRLIATVARPADRWTGFTTHDNGFVTGLRLPLPPGSYRAELVAVDTSSGQAIASGSGRVIVPDPAAKFAMTSLLLSESPNGIPGKSVQLGDASLQPRGDATFTKNESLWYLFGLANAPDPSSVKVNVTVRSTAGGATRSVALPAALKQNANGRYVAGFEMPLSTFEPGSYSLYVTLADAGGNQAVRRADFQVVAP